MRLVSISTVKDESDIVELFVRHALLYVDEMLIIDNGSTDGTRELLAELARERLPISVSDDPSPGHSQAARLTSLYVKASEVPETDFVLPLDADEFIGSPSRAHLEDCLGQLPRNVYGLIPWKTHVLRTEDIGSSSSVLRRMRWRRATEAPAYEKVVIPGTPSWGNGAQIAKGSHSIQHQSGAALPSVRVRDLALRHFPVRSGMQLQKKIVTGWINYTLRDLTDPEANRNEGWHQRAAYDLIIGRDLTAHDMFCISANYAQQRDLLAEPGPDYLVEDPIEQLVESRLDVAARDQYMALARQYNAALALALDVASTPARGPARAWAKKHLPGRLLRGIRTARAASTRAASRSRSS